MKGGMVTKKRKLRGVVTFVHKRDFVENVKEEQRSSSGLNHYNYYYLLLLPLFERLLAS